MGTSNSDLAKVLGTGPKEAMAFTDALAEKIRLATVDDDHREDVVRVLLQLCTVRS
jgi:hypothetical protein